MNSSAIVIKRPLRRLAFRPIGNCGHYAELLPIIRKKGLFCQSPSSKQLRGPESSGPHLPWNRFDQGAIIKASPKAGLVDPAAEQCFAQRL
jgi:hypothetical protein